MANYLIASDLMVELEEVEHTRYLEMFNQKNVRLIFCGDNQFSLPLSVSFFLLLVKKLNKKS